MLVAVPRNAFVDKTRPVLGSRRYRECPYASQSTLDVPPTCGPDGVPESAWPGRRTRCFAFRVTGSSSVSHCVSAAGALASDPAVTQSPAAVRLICHALGNGPART